MRAHTASGFSLVEMIVAVAILVAAVALMFDFIATTQRAGRSQPDASDVNQRLRAAASVLERDLLTAGAAIVHGSPGTLADYLPPIRPARTGAQSQDDELAAFDDRISILYVPERGWSVPLAVDMPDATAEVPVAATAPGCPAAGLCGFTPGARAVIVNTTSLGKGYDVFTVTHTGAGLGHSAPNPTLSQPYAASSTVVTPVVQRVYYLDQKAHRLMVYDGFKTALPLVDNVVDLKFSYFADPHPASVVRPSDELGNCLFAPGDPAVPLLTPLGTTTLTPVELEQFMDGPYCGIPPNRFDGDLLRIRRVRVTIRVQAALDELRGSGADFANAGTSDHTAASVRDFEVTFDVAPRNLRPTR
jgi:prepilin-type N-terminal cleavage/methylation domain-containing protein